MDDAIKSFREAESNIRKLSASDPKNIAYKRMFAIAMDGVGRTVLASSDTAQALTIFRNNLEAAKPYIDSDASNKDWSGNLAIGHGRLGDALFLMGDLVGALRECV